MTPPSGVRNGGLRCKERAILLLAESPGLRPEDVFINLLEVAKENWSFGNGLRNPRERRRGGAEKFAEAVYFSAIRHR